MSYGIEGRVFDALRSHGLRLACAESCTGGLFSARFTRVPGASDVFLGGVVAYTSQVKLDVLGVTPEALSRGAVSRDVTRAMAICARELFAADVAVAITGYAGPSAPSREALGRVHVAIAHWGGVESHDLQFSGEREAVRADAVEEALRFTLASLPAAAKARE